MQFINAHAHFFMVAVTVILLFLVVLFDLKYSMLRDESSDKIKSYSYARVQLAWWSVIILSSFITILFSKGVMPELCQQVLILLGISTATTAAARIMDVSDSANPQKSQSLIQNQPGKGFFLDILSDANGVSVHRFQAVILNIAIGGWFFMKVFSNLSNDANGIMPGISDSVLILLGISSGTYAAIKATENKTNPDGKKDSR